MASTKRPLHVNASDQSEEPLPPNEKRIRTAPLLTSAIERVMLVRYSQSLWSQLGNVLEPMLRRVVREEVERGLQRFVSTIARSPPLSIQAPESPPSLQLVFINKLSLRIFTGTKILDVAGNPLQIFLLNKLEGRDQRVPATLPFPIRIEVVVVESDFSSDGRDSWTKEEFNNKIVKERAGKRPLLTGDLNYTMRGGAVTVGNMEFTDNSSWTKEGRFRLGARVVGESSQGVRVLEALTDAFAVKDHRGEVYKKHYPPRLNDEVWRLEKIAKEGIFHKKLNEAGIHTVQDFLKMSVIDLPGLKAILGPTMSEKMWDGTLKHARSCELGNKLYISGGSDYTLVLNPICEVVQFINNSQPMTFSSKANIDELVRIASDNWNSLEEVDEGFTEYATMELCRLCTASGSQTQSIDNPEMENDEGWSASVSQHII
ncbi:hypothetical protein Ancab_036180 [Ancistrocladus abbreviatus]